MKITGATLLMTDIPLRRPFKTALRTVSAVRDLVLRLETDAGAFGLGEAPPTAVITGDTLGSVAEAVRSFILPALLGRDVMDIENNCLTVQRAMVHNASAKAAAEMALYDLWGQALGQPLHRLLGGAHKQLETDLTISVNPPEEMARDAAQAVQDGFRILKVKVGSDPKLDISRLRAVRAAVPADTVLRVDANQAWSPKQAVSLIGQMEDAGILPELVEQPVPACDVDGLAFVTERVLTPILADEAVFSARDAMLLLSRHAADLINIKLMKCGGISQALAICALADAAGVQCMMGCMLEAGIAVTAAAQVAMAKSALHYIDLDGPALCASNPVRGGAAFSNAIITLPDTPGLGIDGVDGLTPMI